MITFEVKTDLSRLRSDVRLLTRSILPAATARGLNDLAFEARKALQQEMRDVFDRPTPFITNSPFVTQATGGSKALEALGIKTKTATGAYRETKDVLYEVADRFAEIRDGAGKTAAAVDLFGRIGAELIPLLNGGSEGFREMAEMAEKLGLVVDDKAAAAAGRFNDTMGLIQQSTQGVANRLSTELTPLLETLAGVFFDTMTRGDNLRRVAETLAAAFKLLYTAGAVTANVFNAVGKTLGAGAAQFVALLKGDVKGAQTIGKDWMADMVGDAETAMDHMAKVWKGDGDAKVAVLAATAKRTKEIQLATNADRAAADKGAADALAAQVARMKAADKAILDSRKTTFDEIALAVKLGTKTEAEAIEAILAKDEQVFAQRSALAQQELALMKTKANSLKDQEGAVTQAAMNGAETLDSGIAFGPQLIADILSKGINGQSYTVNWQKKKGASAVFNNLEASLADPMTEIVRNMVDAVSTAAHTLRLDDPQMLQRMISLMPVMGDQSQMRMQGIAGGGLVSLNSKTGKEATAELEAVFSSIGDQIARAAVPSLAGFQKAGEGMFQTLVRVAADVEKANYALERFGIAAIDYTQLLDKQGDVAMGIVRQSVLALERTASGALTGVGEILDAFTGSYDDLIQLYQTLVDVRGAMRSVGAAGENLSVAMVRGAGGIDALRTGLQDYFEGFFTEEEQRAANAARLAEEFAKFGVAVPATKEAFRALAQGIDTSSDAGASLFGHLMSLSGAFAKVGVRK